MARQPRCDAQGVAHHVWARGIDGRAIFLDDGDRYDLLHRLTRILPECGMRCLAWALMSNHLHLAVQTGPVPLSTVMKRIHTGFAIRFNRRNVRSGYLFQSRFGSRPIHDESDLLAVIAYVLRNPIAGGLVRGTAELERYRWSSYPALTGRRMPFAFESVSTTLAFFGTDPHDAKESLRAWIARAPAAEAAPATTDGIVRDICRAYAVAEADLRAGRRTRAVCEARAEICRRAIAELALPAREIARALGVAESTVSQALRRPRTREVRGPSPS